LVSDIQEQNHSTMHGDAWIDFLVKHILNALAKDIL
jgi:hypothetical protein